MFIFIGIANTFVSAGMQSIVPLEFLGRVSTVVSTVCMIASPLSNMVYGYLFDKISVSALNKILEDTQKQLKEHTAAHISILKTSSEKNLYLDELKYEIAELANS